MSKNEMNLMFVMPERHVPKSSQNLHQKLVCGFILTGSQCVNPLQYSYLLDHGFHIWQDSSWTVVAPVMEFSSSTRHSFGSARCSSTTPDCRLSLHPRRRLLARRLRMDRPEQHIAWKIDWCEAYGIRLS